MKRSPLPSRLSILGYAALLAAGTFALQLIDYAWLVRRQSLDLYFALVAIAFLSVGVVCGMRLASPRRTPNAPGNAAAVAALGISARELTVLRELAAGRSNKEIARALAVSPNTIKTHVTHLFEKLQVSRRTEAIGHARELGILP